MKAESPPHVWEIVFVWSSVNQKIAMVFGGRVVVRVRGLTLCEDRVHGLVLGDPSSSFVRRRARG